MEGSMQKHDQARVNPHPVMNFHCQNPITENLYFYHFNVRIMSERIAVVRVPCMVRQTSVRILYVIFGGGGGGGAGSNLIDALFPELAVYFSIILCIRNGQETNCI